MEQHVAQIAVYGRAGEALERAITKARTLGCEYVVLSAWDDLAQMATRARLDFVLVAEESDLPLLRERWDALGLGGDTVFAAMPSASKPEGAGVVQVGSLQLDPATRVVLASGDVVEVRAALFDVLLLLAQHGTQGASYEEIIRLVHGGYGNRNIVYDDISELREILGEVLSNLLWIKSGFGYALCAERPPGFRRAHGHASDPKPSARSGVRRHESGARPKSRTNSRKIPESDPEASQAVEIARQGRPPGAKKR